MSGDVQPRKRRDKKKKKEDVAEEVIFQHQHQHQTTTIPTIADDSNIHIQKEASTGGGLCAKVVFFILLSILTALIGLIITEHRGLTDLDTIDTESRFAQIFEGWIDKSPIDHHSEELSIEHSEEETHEDGDEEEEVTGTEEEEEEEEEQEYEQDQSLDQEEEEEEDEEASEEKATDEVETVEETEEDREESNLQDEDTVENGSEIYESENENEEEETEQYEEELEQAEEDQEVDENEYASEEDEPSEGEPDEVSLPTKEDTTPEDDDEDESEEIQILDKIKTEKRKYVVESQNIPEQEESEDAADLTESEEAAQEETEDSPSLDTTQEDTIEKSEEDAMSEEDEIVEPSKPAKAVKPVTKVHSEKISKPETENQEEELPAYFDDEHHESETYNMVVKFGVGTALLVVAHVVLVQKWRTEKIDKKKEDVNNEEPEDVTPDLSRRDTIVTPPSLQEIQQDIENVEEEYSEDEDDYDNQYDGRSKPASAKIRYQELQSTYSNTLTPDWEPREVRERRKDYEEEEDEEELEGEGEGEEDYEDEISENEDEDLLQRLEAKYGRIRQSDEEADDDIEDEGEDDNEDDIEDEEELEEDDYGSWKRVRVPSEDTDSENEKNWAQQRSGAQAAYDFENITNADDWKIRDGLDQAQQNLANE